MEGNLLIKILSSREAEIYRRMREYISFKMQDAFGKLYSENTTLEEISQFTKNYNEARYALGLIDDRPQDYPIYN